MIRPPGRVSLSDVFAQIYLLKSLEERRSDERTNSPDAGEGLVRAAASTRAPLARVYFATVSDNIRDV